MALGKKALAGCGIIFGGFVFLSILGGFISAIKSDPPPKIEAEARESEVAKAEPEVKAGPVPVGVEEGRPQEIATTEEPEQATEEAQASAVAAIAETEQLEPFVEEPPAFAPTPEALAALIPTPSRKWTNPEGKTVLGVISTFDALSGLTTLRTAAGETLSDFPLERFSEADKIYLQDAAKGILTGRVVGVYDGDSLTLLVADNTQFKIRLESIDAPEIGQEYGNNAKQGLAELVHGRDITVHVTGLDKYQRVLGWIYLGRQLVNLAMIEKGLAWNYVEYSKDEKLASAEQVARDAKEGLWKDWKPMSPWEWRALQRANATAKQAAQIAEAQPFISTPSTSTVAKEKPALSYWLNTSGGKRHNSGCRWFANTKSGRYCTKSEGSACGICGG